VIDQPEVAIDSETTGLVSWKDRPLFWSLSWGNRRICMPAETLPAFRHAFADKYKRWIFANAKYDCHMLANVGIEIQGRLIDTQVMHALLHEEEPHNLDHMGRSVLGMSWKGLLDKPTPGVKPTNGVPAWDRRKWPNVGDYLLWVYDNHPQYLIEYASNDAYITFKLYEKLKAALEAAKTYTLYPNLYGTLWDLFIRTEVPFTRVLWSCERNGLKIDVDYLKSKQAPAQKRLEETEREINKLAGYMLNPKSPVQLQDYFFARLGLKPIKFTKGGKSGRTSASVDSTFLEYYADSIPMAKLLLRHRDLEKVLGTYIKGVLDRVDPKGYLHTRFNQDVARTGRLSSSDPNMQNWPKPESDEFFLRGAVICEPDELMMVGDYEALEMRLLAAASGERDMIDIFLRGWDIHMGNASLMYEIPYDDMVAAKKLDKEVKASLDEIALNTTMTSDEKSAAISAAHAKMTAYVIRCLEARGDAKTIGFGLNYGMKAGKLAGRLGCTKVEAQAKIDKYMATYPAVTQFYEQAIEDARRTGYSFTLLGRRRFLGEIVSNNEMERWQAERQAVNTVIQGTAADAAKMAMVNIFESGILQSHGVKMRSQIHDELINTAPRDMVGDPKNDKKAMFMIKEMMEHPFPTDLDVPLGVSIGKGANWLNAK
jgi:DNA polymerase-1